MLNIFSKKESEKAKDSESAVAKTDAVQKSVPLKSAKGGRNLQGVVVSDKMKKTVVVAISNLKLHSKYKKYFTVTKRFKVHDENNQYRIGDKVVIQETRPMSKEKRWVVISKA